MQSIITGDSWTDVKTSELRKMCRGPGYGFEFEKFDCLEITSLAVRIRIYGNN